MYYRGFATAAFLLVTCVNILPAGDDNGTIYADTPQVFTRERLVDQRYTEYQWLQKQLETDAQVTLQGLSDQRISTSFNFNNKLQISPLPGTAAGAAALTNAPSAAFNSFSPITNAPTTNAAPLSPAGAVAAITEISPIDRVKFQQAYRDYLQSLSMQELLDDSHDLEGWTLYTLEFELTMTPGNRVSQPAVVLFHLGIPPDDTSISDKVANRWLARLNLEIGAEAAFWFGRMCQQPDPFVLQKCLEGVKKFQNDENGFKTYQFRLQKFASNVRVQSAFNSTITSQVSSFLANSPAGTSNQSIYSTALNQVNQPQATTNSVNPLAPPKDPPLADPLNSVKNAVDDSVADRGDELKRILTLMDTLIGSPGDAAKQFSPEPLDKTETTDVAQKRAIDNVNLLRDASLISTTYWYVENLAPYLEVDFPRSTSPSAKSTAEKVTPSDGPITIQDIGVKFAQAHGMERFVGNMNIKSNVVPVVQSVEPDEYAQNISDTSTQQQMTNLSLALSAPLLKGINLESYLSYLRTSQDIFETIKRQPLLVSFGRGSSQFGWLIGPQFQINDRKVNFYQTDVKYHVTVSLKMPAWIHNLNLTGEYGWLDDDGHIRDRKAIWRTGERYDLSPTANASKPNMRQYLQNTGSEDWGTFDPGDRYGTVPLQLPANESQMTAAVFQLPRIYRQPLLEGPGDRLTIKTSTSAQTLLIRGKELWRNPKVVVGSTMADFVYIMPDMQSVLARFNTFSEQPPPGKKLPLTIFTTFGRDEIDNVVGFNSLTSDGSGIPKFASLATPVLIEGKSTTVTFNLDASQMPKTYQKIQASYRPEIASGTNSAPALADVTVAPDHTSANFNFSPAPTATGNYFVELLMTPSPETTATTSVLQNGTAKVAFIAKADLGTTLTPASPLSFTTNMPSADIKIAVQNVTSLFTAYPEMKTAVDNGSARIGFISGGKADLKYPIIKYNDSLNTTINQVDLAKITTPGNAKIFDLGIFFDSTTGSSPWIAGPNYSVTVPAPK